MNPMLQLAISFVDLVLYNNIFFVSNTETITPQNVYIINNFHQSLLFLACVKFVTFQ